MLSLEEGLRQSLRSWRREQQDEEGMWLVGDYCFAPEFPGFAGHFPDLPILPAVVQLAAVRQLAELAVAGKLLTVGCRGAKFRGMVRPQELLTVSLHLVPRGEATGWQAKFKLTKDGGLVAGGKLDLRPLNPVVT
ncbi:3-hydroxyacyl-ACP dehydratase FabZ family protein [Desulfurivibrio alkaliphilus]|uniref:Beta-hydroxyacyl-(Acyl-carrier-protein) dehydratase FabA/FabZ n=1 Tax=Desulfurivibrio alkaliphilus (strain DSM 19089 / UNIQEM U267 / AHT2) TaxID=589865 RepID=D6Z2N8_DESAT|nr:beta-hydroxyacyl-ACP dehydratase [Desulfurivibrio alkaliphilus]ADH85813.1 Beta-hydroxyacyl-(acyl-carrier-protein) dehydratase FabA/FabZ [Desulfurivibrio alkaliphilus AHT 2]